MDLRLGVKSALARFAPGSPRGIAPWADILIQKAPLPPIKFPDTLPFTCFAVPVLPRLPPFWSSAIALGRPRPAPAKDAGKRLRINDRIRLTPVRLIDQNDEQVGVMELPDALRRAVAAGLDLVELAPDARPTVCKIMDYGKWKYSQAKKEQKAKSHAKKSELKELRMRPVIDKHDFDLKVKHAREFLLDGDKVQFVMQFKGREIAHKDIGQRTMASAIEQLSDVSKIEGSPTFMGKRYILILTPDTTGAAKKTAPVAGAKPAIPSIAARNETPAASATAAKLAAPATPAAEPKLQLDTGVAPPAAPAIRKPVLPPRKPS